MALRVSKAVILQQESRCDLKLALVNISYGYPILDFGIIEHYGFGATSVDSAPYRACKRRGHTLELRPEAYWNTCSKQAPSAFPGRVINDYRYRPRLDKYYRSESFVDAYIDGAMMEQA